MQKGRRLSAEVTRILWKHLRGFCKPASTFSSLFLERSFSFTLEFGELSDPAFPCTLELRPERWGGEAASGSARCRARDSGANSRAREKSKFCTMNFWHVAPDLCNGFVSAISRASATPNPSGRRGDSHKKKKACKHDYSTCSCS